MDKQALLEKSVKAVYHQGFASVVTNHPTSNGACSYYNPYDNSRCGIGHLLPKEVAVQLQSTIMPVRALLQEHEGVNQLLAPANESDIRFLDLLQNAHDVSEGSNFKADYKDKIKESFNDMDLTFLEELK